MDEHYREYYLNCKRPPFAPTFYPTEEEFTNPIEYIARIKAEAEDYGVVKIKPPASFRPPFAINAENFTFKPRVQKLNEIDALIRIENMFDTQLAAYWRSQGRTFSAECIGRKIVNYFRLYRVRILAFYFI
ncbi:unnamed protein product [Gongylonema pulchrum]|uniref:JmjN domain-containing protein n=1 Tax=Gongylonema pulchrum TaxID=637853 RepID=A0A183E4B7_9BILA|nr:unnamed protein product [Gongylonema pulchrum]